MRQKTWKDYQKRSKLNYLLASLFILFLQTAGLVTIWNTERQSGEGEVVEVGVETEQVTAAESQPPIDFDPKICSLDFIECPGQKKIIGTITAYTAIETCGDKCINASGKNPIKNKSIACPRKYPLKTKVIIDGNEFICDDRTAVWTDGRWDIFYGYTIEDYNKALKFGKNTKLITILN